MTDYKTDLEIAREAKKIPITEIAQKRLSIQKESLIPYGHYKAKIDSSFLGEVNKNKDMKNIITDKKYLSISKF